MIVAENLVKQYRLGRHAVTALDGVSLHVKAGEMVVITGPSGCGKTTLLMTMGGLLRPTSGRVLLEQNDIYALSASARAALRGRDFGFVFQMFHLTPYLNVLDNVLLHVGAGSQHRDAAIRALESLGLGERLRHKPAQLSVGERQRVGLARATLLEPKVLLADEPTGNLDEENAHEVLRQLSDYRRKGHSVIVVTHGPMAADYADRVVRLRAGRLVGEESYADREQPAEVD